MPHPFKKKRTYASSPEDRQKRRRMQEEAEGIMDGMMDIASSSASSNHRPRDDQEFQETQPRPQPPSQPLINNKGVNKHNDAIEENSSGSSSGKNSGHLRRGGSDRRKDYAAMQNGNPKDYESYQMRQQQQPQRQNPNQMQNDEKPTDFLINLYSMLQDPSLSNYISWSVPLQNEPPHLGGGIAGIGKLIVNDASQLEARGLHKYYDRNNYDSFQRHLYEYGFVKRHHFCIRSNGNSGSGGSGFKQEEDSGQSSGKFASSSEGKSTKYLGNSEMRSCSYIHDLLGREPQSLLLLKPKSGGMVGNASDGDSGEKGGATSRNNDGKEEDNNSVSINDAAGVAAGVTATTMTLPVASKMMPEVYYNQKINIDGAEVSNLTGVEPKLNMPLEIRDPDSIWSAAKIIDIIYADNAETKGKGKGKGKNKSREKAPSDDIDVDDYDEQGKEGEKKCRVKIRYEGWGSEWDEIVSYPNARLARIFTYTKKVKCFVELLSKHKSIVSGKKPVKKKEYAISSTGSVTSSTSTSLVDVRNWTDMWPCKVSFRMPHPSTSTGNSSESKRQDITALFNPSSEQEEADTAHQRSELLLRLEPNVFVEPYAPECIPAYLRQGKRMAHGGWWISGKKLRLFKEMDVDHPISFTAGVCVLRELSATFISGSSSSSRNNNNGSQSATAPIEYHFAKDFVKAFRCAQSDKWVRGYLPSKVLDEGSLVVDWHRVRNVGGDAIDGVLYSGAFDPKISYRSKSLGSSRGSSPVPPTFSQDTATAELSTDSCQATPQRDVSNNQCEKGPSLPSIPINEVIYKSGVRRLSQSNRWASTVRVNGNEIFLGTFASQTEANEASKIVLDQEKFTATESPQISDSKAASTQTAQDHETTENIGRMTDLLSVPIESVVSAFEEKTHLVTESGCLSPVQQKAAQTSFRLHDWVMQHYRHAQQQRESSQPSGDCAGLLGGDVQSNDYTLMWNRDMDAPKIQKRRKQSIPTRLSHS